MRIALVNEGTYPVVKGGVSTWCDQLIRGLLEHEFHLVTIVGHERRLSWEVPDNVAATELVPMWEKPPPEPSRGRRRRQRRLDQILGPLWAAALPADSGTEPDRQALAAALRELAHWDDGPLPAALAARGSGPLIIAAWEQHRRQRPGLPPLSLAQAVDIARLADRMLAMITTPVPRVDVIHTATNGPAAVAALGAHWRDDTPLVLTEHGVYLRERYLALAAAGFEYQIRYAVMALIRGLCQVTYDEAAFISPVSEFNVRWERRLGAKEARIVTIHNGVDTTAYLPVVGEPTTPTVSFVGRIDPLKDLETLIDAFALVVPEVPGAMLRLFGPTPVGNEAYRARLDAQVARLGLSDSVVFEGSRPSAMPAFEAGHVVALSSVSEGLPFTVMEAMMAGRPTVNTDVGGVCEVVGDDGAAGLVVPPRDPQAMADALVALLQDAPRRAAMGAAARERSLAMFSLDLFLARYRRLYEAAQVGTVIPEDPALSEELARILSADLASARCA